ncbi:hypothetical protein [Curtobacterium sp. Leaf261]|uniref:hypothetical protein n=1 Tax=Curtobacterium sp. Leaf261 TaxID=1736311 RepID=UPI0006FF6F6B|nr:hypothetical protein [Curtobacterium sp. Leaf261]KQO63395.1 hypothetical protein ASF23_03790 [Curtobacterium sp. Leaf261]
MSITNWSGGIVLLVAAVLWLAYLMPSWHARRQYLATERNAIRLQQTLRILAQTAELPEEIRVEMNAKSLAEAQRVAASEEARRRAIVRAHEAARQREITRRLAEQAPELERVASSPALTAMRMRRSRLGATLFGLLGIVVALVTLVAAPAMWLVALAGGLAVVGSVAVLVQLAAVGRARSLRGATSAPVRTRASRPAQRSATSAAVPPAVPTESIAAEEDRTWTPVEVPRPLYVSRPDVERAREDARRAAAESSSALAARLRERVAAAAADADAEAEARRAEAARIASANADPSGARVTRMRSDVEAAAAALAEHDDAPAASLAERMGLRAPTPTAGPIARSLAAEAVADARAGHRSGVDVGDRSQADAPVEAPQPPSRYAGMGMLDTDSYERTDLDAVLRRRRAV